MNVNVYVSVCVYDGILFSLEKEGHSDTCNTDEPQGHYGK